MQMSNIILPQIEDFDLDAFPYLTLITYLHVNNKSRKYKLYLMHPYGVQILSFLKT